MTKNCLLLFMLLFLGITSGKVHARACSCSYNDSAALKIERVEEFNGFGTGSGYIYPKKGYKFLGVYMLLTNNTEESQELDMKTIFLADTANRIKYAPKFVMKTGPFTVFQKSRKLLKSGGSLNRKLVFSIPEDVDPAFLLYNDQLIALKFRPGMK